MSRSTFTGNTVIGPDNGGGIYFGGINGRINDCNFTSNSANSGGGLFWFGADGILTASIFIDNIAKNNVGGGLFWFGADGKVTDSTFKNNSAKQDGGGIRWSGAKGTLSSSIFNDNTARYGGAISWTIEGSMINCTFNNNKWINDNSKSNGIYIAREVNIKGGKGIVDVIINQTLSGTSIIVLNNETYYYPPNTNINFNYTK